MARPDFPRTIMQFQDPFATDAACLDYLAASRWPEGFICPRCGGNRAWVLERRHLWQCSACALQTSVTAGTVMHRTRTPLRTWFWAASLVATHHPGISALASPPSSSSGGYEEGLKGSRQRGKKALVGAAIEVRGAGSGRLRLQVLANSRAKTLEAFAKATTAPGAIVHTDALNSCAGLAKLGYQHRPRKADGRCARRPTAVAGAPSDLQPQGVGARHPSRRLKRASARLPRRVVFRHSRRGTPMAAFQTLLGLGVIHDPATYDEITALRHAA